jgi:hypothetical protein
MSIQLNSIDGRSFLVSREVCGIAKHIQNTLNISDQDEELPVMDLMRIQGGNLEKIVEFMNEYHKNPFDTITKDTKYETLPAYYRNMLESTKLITDAGDLSDVTLMNMMVGASSLEMDCLTSLIAYYMAYLIKDKPLRERYVIFGLPADHVADPEEVNKIRKEYAYVFKNDEAESDDDDGNGEDDDGDNDNGYSDNDDGDSDNDEA